MKLINEFKKWLKNKDFIFFDGLDNFILSERFSWIWLRITRKKAYKRIYARERTSWRIRKNFKNLGGFEKWKKVYWLVYWDF